MADSQPLVSIGMPVYNGERFIRQALDSLLAQDCENFELIISDNASADGTQEICLEYAAQDGRIRYYRNENNLGALANFNRVLGLAQGPYFMWAAHDDVWDARKFKLVLGALGFRKPVFVFSEWQGTYNVSVETYKLPPFVSTETQLETARDLLRLSLVDEGPSEHRMWAAWCQELTSKTANSH